MKKIVLLCMLVLLYSSTLLAQSTINGKVQDKDGKPLEGATIKSKTETVKTNEQGAFSIKAKAGEKLLITFIGMNTAFINAADGMVASLEQASRTETEIIVTGYSTKSKRANTGSASTVTIEDVRSQPIASFDQLLQGQAPGLNVKSGSGQPGRSADVVIRGKGSVNGSTSPLYILDGIEIRGGDFSTLNQADFENVTILKDAASTSIYGSRGANGVIVITTKKGRAGKLKFSYDVQYGNSQLPKNQLELMNTQEKVDFEINPKLGNNPYGWSPTEADSLRKINTNWDDYVFQKGQTISHQLSASGGNDKTTFYTSLSYLNQEGVVIQTGLKRYNGRINVTHKEDNIKVGANLSGGWSSSNGTDEGNQSVAASLNTVLWALPYEAPYTNTGDYAGSLQFPFWINPVQELVENKNSSWQLKSTGNVFLEYKLPWIKNLTYKINTGGDYSQLEGFAIRKNGTQRADLADPDLTRVNGQLTRSLDRRFTYTITNSLGYKTYIDKSENHSLGASLYHEFVKSQGRNFGYTGFGLLQPFDNEAAITQGTNSNNFIPTVNGGFPLNSTLMSYFSSIDYSFKNRYFLTLSGRTDGSSKLSKDKRWTKYGSIGLGWIVTDESFFKLNVINYLKLRASFGSVGNQNGIGQFPYLQQYGGGSYAGASTLQVSRLGNNELTWEKRRTVNIGLDYEILKNRIRGTIEVYNSLTKDLYFSPFVPSTSGGSGLILGNTGSMENRGIELSLGLKIIDKKDFKWSIDANYSYNKNSIKSLPNNQDFQLYNSFQALKVGKPFNTFYLVDFVGVNPANGNSQFTDINTKGITETYDPKNNQFLGTSDAPTNGGFTNTISYKGIELSTFFVFSTGNYIYNNARLNVENNGYVSSGFSRNALSAWTTPGQVTNFPRLTESTESNTTRFLEKGDFWRLRNVMLSYNVPKKLLDKMKIQGLRVFLQGQNLYTKFKFQGWDPEVSSVNDADPGGSASVSGAQYPALKSMTLGLNVTF
jgi:TonB-dependent starch-binding outer membrane protein SusC